MPSRPLQKGCCEFATKMIPSVYRAYHYHYYHIITRGKPKKRWFIKKRKKHTGKVRDSIQAYPLLIFYTIINAPDKRTEVKKEEGGRGGRKDGE
jgi:hypothetical protein